MNKEQIAFLINRRQRQILVHSIIYYRFDLNIVDDYTWTQWANELIKLQKEYPEIALAQKYGEVFKNFDTPSGYNLPLDDPDMTRMAQMLLAYNNGEKDAYKYLCPAFARNSQQ